MHLAVEIGNLEIIKLLLEKKEIDINIKDSHGKKPIDYSKNHEIMQLLSKWFSIHYKGVINKNQLINYSSSFWLSQKTLVIFSITFKIYFWK